MKFDNRSPVDLKDRQVPLLFLFDFPYPFSLHQSRLSFFPPFVFETNHFLPHSPFRWCVRSSARHLKQRVQKCPIRTSPLLSLRTLLKQHANSPRSSPLAHLPPSTPFCFFPRLIIYLDFEPTSQTPTKNTTPTPKPTSHPKSVPPYQTVPPSSKKPVARNAGRSRRKKTVLSRRDTINMARCGRRLSKIRSFRNRIDGVRI